MDNMAQVACLFHDSAWEAHVQQIDPIFVQILGFTPQETFQLSSMELSKLDEYDPWANRERERELHARIQREGSAMEKNMEV